MRNLLFLLSCVYLFVSACTGNQRDASYFSTQIDSLNHNLQRGIRDTTRVQSLANDIKLYVNKNTDDSAAPKLMFDLATAQINHRLHQGGIRTLKEVRERFPNSKYASQALLLEGYVCANDLKDYDAARNVYNEYLKEYSEVDANLTRDVTLEIRRMGKTPDQIMAEIDSLKAIETAANASR